MTAPTATHQAPPSANSLLMSGGVTAAKFDTVGVTVGGRIVREPATKQQTDFDSGALKYWDDGSPMWQIVVHVQTEQRDPAIPNDDGVRGLYLKNQLMQAAREAVKTAGAAGLEEGGELWVTYVSNEPNSRGRGNDKKVYTCRYTPPVSPVNQVLMGTAATPPAPPTPVEQAAAGGHMHAPNGIDPGVWARLDAGQRAQVLAATAPAGSTPPF